MADWAYNPVHGWAPGPYDALNCEYPFPSPFDSSVQGFFPAPPGYMWADPSVVFGGGGMGCSGLCGMGMMGGCGGGCGGGGGGEMMTMPPMMSGGLGGYPGMIGIPPNTIGGRIPGGQTWQQIGDQVENGGTPGINLKNDTGGIGLEPGYNYIFPDEHVKIHVLKTSCPPWQLEGTEEIEYQAHKVPTCITVRTMMDGFGCDNKEPKKNVVYELAQGGNGKWYRGISMKGDDQKKMGKTVGDMGWGGGGDPVWLYFTKD